MAIKRPPYSKYINEKNPKDVKIFCGPGRWDLAKNSTVHFGNAVVLPEIEEFTEYQWPVKGRGVFVYDFDLPRKVALVFAKQLLDIGAVNVTVVFDSKCKDSIYVERKRK